MTLNKTLIIIVGPTAVGKTAIGIRLAKRYGTEILSADSRQFFKEMEIGTAKPSKIELSEVPHHFINSLSIQDNYNIADFEGDTMNLIRQLLVRHDKIIMVGGSGLYIDAICNGLDEFPAIDSQIRKDLLNKIEINGIEYLQKQLKRLDPSYYQQVDINNTHRVIRALEICIGTGKPFSSFLGKQKVKRPFQILKIGLELDREILYARINQRMDNMIAQGLFEEAKSLYSFRHLNALQTVGYKEIFGFFDGEYDREEAIRLLKRNTRRFAKRQMTWFRKDESVKWFSPENLDEIQKYIDAST